MKSYHIYSLCTVLICLFTGCSTDKIPGVYRIDIQQGNYVSQEMVNKLEAGMTKKQVAYIMGTPLLIDTFHPERWDYLYSFQPGNGEREQRRITLFFNEDDKLTHIGGNTALVTAENRTEVVHNEKNVAVPLKEQKSGFFSGLLNVIGFGEEKSEIIESNESMEASAQP